MVLLRNSFIVPLEASWTESCVYSPHIFSLSVLSCAPVLNSIISRYSQHKRPLKLLPLKWWKLNSLGCKRFAFQWSSLIQSTIRLVYFQFFQFNFHSYVNSTYSGSLLSSLLPYIGRTSCQMLRWMKKAVYLRTEPFLSALRDEFGWIDLAGRPHLFSSWVLLSLSPPFQL